MKTGRFRCCAEPRSGVPSSNVCRKKKTRRAKNFPTHTHTLAHTLTDASRSVRSADEIGRTSRRSPKGQGDEWWWLDGYGYVESGWRE
jgi:hypothetical protein